MKYFAKSLPYILFFTFISGYSPSVFAHFAQQKSKKWLCQNQNSPLWPSMQELLDEAVIIWTGDPTFTTPAPLIGKDFQIITLSDEKIKHNYLLGEKKLSAEALQELTTVDILRGFLSPDIVNQKTALYRRLRAEELSKKDFDAYYDSELDTVNILECELADNDPIAWVIDHTSLIVHEFSHMLTDCTYAINDMIISNRDSIYARTFINEGVANTLQYQYYNRILSGESSLPQAEFLAHSVVEDLEKQQTDYLQIIHSDAQNGYCKIKDVMNRKKTYPLYQFVFKDKTDYLIEHNMAKYCLGSQYIHTLYNVFNKNIAQAISYAHESLPKTTEEILCTIHTGNICSPKTKPISLKKDIFDQHIIRTYFSWLRFNNANIQELDNALQSENDHQSLLLKNTETSKKQLLAEQENAHWQPIYDSNVLGQWDIKKIIEKNSAGQDYALISHSGWNGGWYWDLHGYKESNMEFVYHQAFIDGHLSDKISAPYQAVAKLADIHGISFEKAFLRLFKNGEEEVLHKLAQQFSKSKTILQKKYEKGIFISLLYWDTPEQADQFQHFLQTWNQTSSHLTIQYQRLQNDNGFIWGTARKDISQQKTALFSILTSLKNKIPS
ncbi:MAG: hypothetical protein KDK51_07535 [Deltaproteobacteria bacterium]|nr:hypothetical protein [Deltaproteobacteria bacterium]